ncbi:MAG: hypothetical protein O9320_08755 [Magnetospirillum sp.]|nr:hypothetical protein [Magnetospirillum sp.]
MSDGDFETAMQAVAARQAADVPKGETGMGWVAVEAVQIVGRLVGDAAWCRRASVLDGLVQLAALAKVAHAHAKRQFDKQTGRG